VVLIGVGLGTWFTVTFVANPGGGDIHWAAVAVMLVVGFAGSVLINAAVLTLALQPLHALERTVDRVAAGDLSARAQPVLFRDPDVERLGETLNTMLDVLGEHRAILQTLSEQVLAAQEAERELSAHGFHDDDGRLPPQLELVLYRVVQEALTNAAKHAAARGIRVELRRNAAEVVARVSDDGTGFDVEDMMRSRERGLGLFGMQERLVLVRGQLVSEGA